ncbi:PH domain-containing protein [Flavobacterium chuncheonense]|uniref:PH domain-containing protein n=1 Tax=Flavobacterium chuncheonense TaxID=2026653 RepID=A0ABW5YLH2_9FLAO
MQHFSNQEINLSSLPQFETVVLNRIESKYYKVILINIGIILLLLGLGLGTLWTINAKLFPDIIWVIIGIVYVLVTLTSFIFSRLSFERRGFAFREHDAIYKSGVIAQTTTIVPYKRVQHVALHQGLFSRYFGLASLELFTAGGSTTDLEIKGLKLEEAQQYKHWIIKKIDDLAEETEEETAESIVEIKPNLDNEA